MIVHKGNSFTSSLSQGSISSISEVEKEDNDDISEEGAQDCKDAGPETELIFSVDFLVLSDKELAKKYFFRVDDQAYKVACMKDLSMHIFPPKLKKNTIYRPEFIQISRIALAVRVRRLLLQDEYEKLKTDLKVLKSLVDMCNDRINLLQERLGLLEKEMEILKQGCPDTVTTKFCAVLMNSLGYVTITTIVQKQIQMIQQAAKSNRHNLKYSTLQSTFLAWDLLQYFQLIHAVKIRCELGEKKYPIKTNQINRKNAKKIHEYKESWSKIKHTIDSLRLIRNFDENDMIEINDVIATLSMKYAVKGSGIGDWLSVCRALASQDESLLSAVNAVILIISSPTVMEFIHSDTIFDIKHQVWELEGDGESNKEARIDISHLLTIVLDDIADELEAILLQNILREDLLWDEFLTTIRRERIIRAGGNVVIRNKLEVEVDRYGDIKSSIPLADGNVDTAIFHGSMQRIKASLAIPKAQDLISKKSERLVEVSGELPCVIQYGYESCIVYIQRFFRKILARKVPPPLLRELVYQSMNACACIIQSWYRTRRQIWEYRVLKVPDYDYYAIYIQTVYRGFIQRKKYKIIYDKWIYERRYHGAILMQAIIRGYLVRHRIKKLLTDLEVHKEMVCRIWAATIIQKRIRGYIVRTSLIRTLRIRKTLSKDILRLAGKYLNNGDIWGFLQDMDREFTRLSTHIDSSQHQEDEYAKTFVEKVLVKRRAEFDIAWDSFSKVVNDHNNSSSDHLHHQKTHVNDDINDKIGKQRKKKLRQHPREGGVYDDGGVDGYGNGDEEEDYLSGISHSHSRERHTSLKSPSPQRHNNNIKSQKQRKSQVNNNKNSRSSNNNNKKNSSKNNNVMKANSGHISAADVAYGSSSQSSTTHPVSVPPGETLRRAISATVQDRVSAVINKMEDDNAKFSAMQGVYLNNNNSNSNGSGGGSGTGYGTGSGSVSRKKKAAKPKTKVTDKGISNSKGYQEGIEKKISSSSSINELNEFQFAEMNTNSNSYSNSNSYMSPSQSPVKSALKTSNSHSHSHHLHFRTGTSNTNRSRNNGNGNSNELTWSLSLPLPAIEQSTVATIATSLNNNLHHLGGPPAFHGDSLLIDIPLALNDSLERLVRAASVRSHIPDFFPNGTPDMAYKLYQNMPPGLGKLRFEESAWLWCKPVIENLRNQGLRSISDLMPPSKLAIYFRDVNAPTILIESCMKICVELKRMASVALGLHHKPTMRKSKKVLEQGGVYYSNEPVINREEEMVTTPTPPTPVLEPLRPVTANEYVIDTNKSLDKIEIERLKNVLLGNNSNSSSSSSTIAWMNLKADINELFQHAGYLVCRHIPLQTLKKTDFIDNGEGELGESAFLAHLTEIHQLQLEEHKKESIRCRVQRTAQLVDPYIFALRSNGIHSIMDLIQTNLDAYSLPVELQLKIESLLNIAVAHAIETKVSIASKKFPQQKTKNAKLPLTYDPRYQRSPFDPCGRPPRLTTLDALVQTKKKIKHRKDDLKKQKAQKLLSYKYNRSVDDDDDDDSGLFPGGIWDEMTNNGSTSHSHSNSPNTNPHRKMSTVADSMDMDEGHDGKGSNSGGGSEGLQADSFWKFRSSNEIGVAPDGVRLGVSMRSLDDEQDQRRDYHDRSYVSSAEENYPRRKQNQQQHQLQQQQTNTSTFQEDTMRWRRNLRTPEKETTTSSLASSGEQSPDAFSTTIPGHTGGSHTQTHTVGSRLHTPNNGTSKRVAFIPPDAKNNTFICTHFGCGQVFSRAYTLKIHEKAHTLFAGYSDFTRDPKLFVDPDRASMIAEQVQRVNVRTTLPPLIQRDVDLLRKRAAAAATGSGGVGADDHDHE
eukprot:gene7287-14864_t